MSEYIVELDSKHSIALKIAFAEEMRGGDFVHGEIIRCRDCKHFHTSMTSHTLCARLLDIYGNSMTFNAKPEDYCAWAESKVGVRE